MTDHNDLAWWLPRLQHVSSPPLPLPETVIVHARSDLTLLLDGMLPAGYPQFLDELRSAALLLGPPVFLRTGHGSGKHYWSDCCYLDSAEPEAVAAHVFALVEWSNTVDLLGLPTETWAVRQLLPTRPIFLLPGHQGMPVVREFRFFAEVLGEALEQSRVTHVQPYWPEAAVAQGRPEDPRWRGKLAAASVLTPGERLELGRASLRGARALGAGEWSLDWLQAADGAWWLTDVAEGARSFRWGHGS